jgi:hypothetical protein
MQRFVREKLRILLLTQLDQEAIYGSISGRRVRLVGWSFCHLTVGASIWGFCATVVHLCFFCFLDGYAYRVILTRDCARPLPQRQFC